MEISKKKWGGKSRSYGESEQESHSHSLAEWFFDYNRDSVYWPSGKKPTVTQQRDISPSNEDGCDCFELMINWDLKFSHGYGGILNHDICRKHSGISSKFIFFCNYIWKVTLSSFLDSWQNMWIIPRLHSFNLDVCGSLKDKNPVSQNVRILWRNSILTLIHTDTPQGG